MVRGLTLKMILPPLYNPGNDWVWSTVPSSTNFPALWFGLPNGTITGKISGFYQAQYYSTNTTVINDWFTPFTTYVSYSQNQNQFLFTGISNVIVQSGFSSNNAGSGIFRGFDPVN